MSGVELLSLKQQLNQLNESERREVTAYLIRMGQESEQWKQETARRLDQMQSVNEEQCKLTSERLREMLDGQ